jgi:hypothetical protein
MRVLFIGVSPVLVSRDGRDPSPTEKWSEKTTESGVVAIHDFGHSYAPETARGQVAIRLKSSPEPYRNEEKIPHGS